MYILLSWLNFDLGIDTCFYSGMDTYVKTWLQLAIHHLTIVVILGHNVGAFGCLIGRKDPVATLYSYTDLALVYKVTTDFNHNVLFDLVI